MRALERNVRLHLPARMRLQHAPSSKIPLAASCRNSEPSLSARTSPSARLLCKDAGTYFYVPASGCSVVVRCETAKAAGGEHSRSVLAVQTACDCSCQAPKAARQRRLRRRLVGLNLGNGGEGRGLKLSRGVRKCYVHPSVREANPLVRVQ